MEKIEYLPLGSVVLLNGGIKKIVIIARGLTVLLDGKNVFFDYAAVQYPEGLVGEELAYFNHDGIAKVIFKGFSDDDEKIMVENINQYANQSSAERMGLEELRERNK